jgi:hypothetical protein
MSQHKAITDRILEQLRCAPECELEELVYSCPEFTSHETLLELVRLNRTGEMKLKSNGRGIYHIRLCSSGQHDYHTHREVGRDPTRAKRRA